MTAQNNTQFHCIDCDEVFSNLPDLKEHQSHHAHESHNLKTNSQDLASRYNQWNGQEETVSQQKSFGGNKIITLVLGVFVTISILQTIQTYIVFSNLKSGPSIASASTKQAITSQNVPSSNIPQGQSALPSGLQNLPNMVGGC